MPETPDTVKKEKSHHSLSPHHDEKETLKKKKKRKSLKIHEVKEKIKEKFEKASEERGHHHSRHNSVELPKAPQAETAEPAPVVAPVVADNQDKKKDKKEKRRSVRTAINLFKPSIVDTEIPKTFARRPSVKLTDELLENVFQAWDQTRALEKPAPHLVERLQAGLKPVFSQHVELSGDEDDLMNALSAVADQLKTQVDQYESERPEYRVDIDLSKSKTVFEEKSKVYEETYAKALQDYNAEMQTLEAKIQDIDQQKTNITADAVLDKLKTLTVYQELHQKIVETIRDKQQLLDSRTCTQKLFFCHQSNEQKQLAAEMGRLEAQRMMLSDGGRADEVRAALINKLEEDRAAIREKLNALIQNKPVYSNEANSAFIRVDARISQDRTDYYHQVDAVVMMALMRMMRLLDKLSKLLPRPSTVETSDTPSKADPFLCKLVDGLRDRLRQRLELFYCATPGKYFYNDYQKNLKALDKKAQRDIMLGTALPETVQKVIPEYPAPLEPTLRMKMG